MKSDEISKKDKLFLDLTNGEENENPVENIDFAEPSEKSGHCFYAFGCFGVGKYDTVC